MAQDMQQRPADAERLRQALDRRADVMVATRHAVVEGRKAMALIEKMNLLAQRRRELSQKMETRADDLMQRYDAMPARIDGAFDKHLAQLDAEEKQFREMDDAIDRLTNGDPTEGSGQSGGATGA